MDLDGIQRMIVGKASQFGWLVRCSLDSPTAKLVGGILAHMESIMDGHIKAIVCGEKITIDQMLIV
jgi:hypothetical protein